MATIASIQEDTKKEVALRRAMLGQKPLGKLKRPPQWLFPRNAETQYRKLLDQIIATIEKEVKEVLIPSLPRLFKEANQLKPDAKLDSFVDDLLGLITSIGISTQNNTPKPEVVAQTVGADISVFNRKEFLKSVRSVLGVNIVQQEPWLSGQLDLFASQNVDLIKNLSDNALDQIKGTVQRGLAAGQRPSELSTAISGRIGVAKSRAKLIARDQTNKLNGQLTQLRQTSIGVEQYQWSTAGDERVRPSHAEKDGNIYKWSDPPADTGHPGNDVNCRCVAVPVLNPLAS